MDMKFSGEVVEWRGPAPYYFIDVPEEESLHLHTTSAGDSYGWGMLPVQVRIGGTDWKTSLWPKDGRYLLPLKDVVRKAERLDVGASVTVRLTTTRTATGPKRRPSSTPRPAVVRSPSKEPVTENQLAIVPANEASWDDLRAVFGTSGDPHRCWCQRFKMVRRESWASVGPEGLAARLRAQTFCDQPDSATTSGLVAYLDAEPVGWCAVGPRSEHPRLLRDCRVPWVGRTEDKADDSVWAVTCFVVRKGFRGRGISRALARTAVDFARQRGARALEGYPDLVEGGHVGTHSVFADAGLVEVNRPTNRRAVMRVEFRNS